MTLSRFCTLVLFAFAINIGYPSDSLMAQPGYAGHSGSCAGGCNHDGGGNSIDLIPYGPSGQAALRQSYQQRLSPPSNGQRDAMRERLDYAQQYPTRSPSRSAYQGNPNSPSGRGNYQTRREDFIYANAPGPSNFERHGQGDCRGGCAHGNRGGGYDDRGYDDRGYDPRGYDDRGYDGDEQPTFDRGPSYRNEADQAPRLNMYPPGRGNQSAMYGQSFSDRPYNDRSLNNRSLQLRQEYANPQSQGGIGTTSQETFSPTGPPPTPFGFPSNTGTSGGDHAGCNHDHN